MPEISPCQYAQDRHKNLALWRNLWTILVFTFGSAVVLFLILSIFLFLTKSWLPGALSALGTLVSGAGSAWVVTRRLEAVKEEEEGFNEVMKACGDTNKAVAVRSQLSLVGKIR